MTKEQLKPYLNCEVRMLLHSTRQPCEWVQGTLIYMSRPSGGLYKSYYLLHNHERWCGGNLHRAELGDYRYDWSVRGGYSSDITLLGVGPKMYIKKHNMTQ
jgi:hypothetical protein